MSPSSFTSYPSPVSLSMAPAYLMADGPRLTPGVPAPRSIATPINDNSEFIYDFIFPPKYIILFI